MIKKKVFKERRKVNTPFCCPYVDCDCATGDQTDVCSNHFWYERGVRDAIEEAAVLAENYERKGDFAYDHWFDDAVDEIAALIREIEPPESPTEPEPIEVDFWTTEIDPGSVSVICYHCEARGRPRRDGDMMYLPEGWVYKVEDLNREGAEMKAMCLSCQKVRSHG